MSLLLLFPLLVAAGALAGGYLYQQLGLRRDRRLHPPLGRLLSIRVSGGKKRVDLHLLEQGAGVPAVMLESGIAGSLLGWSLVQGDIAQFTSVFSYDRAGLGWSRKPQQPRTVDNMLSELHELLHEARVQPPLVLVGHSFGGLLVRAYAHRWPEQVAGLILVDPVGHSNWANTPESERTRLRHAVTLSRRGALLADLGVVRGALALLVSGRRWLPDLVGRMSARQGTRVLRSLVGEVQQLPAWTHPKIRAHWSNARCFRAMADYLEALPECASTAVDLSVRAEIPVTVLSATTAKDHELEEREVWVAASDRGRHILVRESGHWIQIHQPSVVIEAVLEMVRFLRQQR